ncbi:hypothetical protein [Arthrobacter sp. M4]|uniref:hypothetical protein n=1 Tax=Arthrobacter sp. M4 TaxID=218160 RepID=UPI001CDB82F9|nr:hypothetical protein [Arthrobacter sp. M4]MCA4132659.1 hypothetical protein [Arthrobacter sp. M4]
MSRTDKTQPFRVRLWDGTLRRVAVHDHRDGICDLPANVQEDRRQVVTNGGFLPNRSCHWEFQYTGSKTCCCSVCHDGDGLRHERRAERHRNRRELANLLKLAHHDWRNID